MSNLISASLLLPEVCTVSPPRNLSVLTTVILFFTDADRASISERISWGNEETFAAFKVWLTVHAFIGFPPSWPFWISGLRQVYNIPASKFNRLLNIVCYAMLPGHAAMKLVQGCQVFRPSVGRFKQDQTVWQVQDDFIIFGVGRRACQSISKVPCSLAMLSRNEESGTKNQFLFITAFHQGNWRRPLFLCPFGLGGNAVRIPTRYASRTVPRIAWKKGGKFGLSQALWIVGIGLI